ncbi:hypothetical protein [Bacillus thuringiensis]|nr:hypothetical protein [Bacillus thuringiensis]
MRAAAFKKEEKQSYYYGWMIVLVEALWFIFSGSGQTYSITTIFNWNIN